MGYKISMIKLYFAQIFKDKDTSPEKLVVHRSLNIAWIFFFITSAFLWAWSMIHFDLGSHFTQDSFGYFLLAKNIFSGLGFTSFSARDFYIEPTWPVISRSFPPLHPFLIGLVDLIFGFGIRSAALLNIFVLFGTIVTFLILSRTLNKSTWFVIAFSFILFFWANPYYREELIAGRSIPCTIMFYYLAIIFFAKSIISNNNHRWHECMCGFFLCLMLHERFDQMLFCLLFIPASFIFYRLNGSSNWESFIKSGTITLVLVVFSLPWVIRNIIQFQTPFASNNTMAVISVNPDMACLNYWLPGDEPPTIYTAPNIWINQRIAFLVKNLKKIWEIAKHVIYIAPIAALAVWRRFHTLQKMFAIVSVLNMAASLITVSLTPYGDHRYFSLIHANLCIITFIGIASFLDRNRLKKIRNILFVLTIPLLVSLLLLDTHRTPLIRYLLKGQIIPNDTNIQQIYFETIKDAFQPYLSADDLLGVSFDAEKFTYFTGYKTISFPTNMRVHTRGLKQWMERWHVDFLILYNEQVKILNIEELVVAEAYGRSLIDFK